MRRYLLLPILLASLMAGAASAQSPMPSPEPALAPVAPSRPGDLGPWWRDSDLAAEIDLDDATVDELEQLFLDHRLRLADLAAELDRARAALDFARNQTARNQADRDDGAVRDAEDSLYDVRSRLQTARAELMVEIRARLDGEQWAQLESYRDRHRLPAPPAPAIARTPRPAPLATPAPAPPQQPEAPPHPEAPPRPTRPDDARPVLAPTPEAPPAPPVAPSAPLRPAPPALSWWTDASVRSELRLDREQLQILESTTRDAAPRLQDLQQQVRDAETELSRLVASTDLDHDAARRQVERLAEVRRVLLDAGRELERELLDVLTAEQRRRLDSI